MVGRGLSEGKNGQQKTNVPALRRGGDDSDESKRWITKDIDMAI
jgi:hypothetical protein